MELPRPAADGFRPHFAAGRLLHFGLVGAACTVAFALLYAALRGAMGPLEANAIALTATMLLNFAANRWLTFDARDGSLGRQVVKYGLVYVLGLGASTVIFRGALIVTGPVGPAAETFLALASGAAATVIRFILLSAWVFRPADEPLPSLPHERV